jgi:putative molybdopterin biosynthesis protein
LSGLHYIRGVGDARIISRLGGRRKAAGLSQSALAAQVGVSRQALIAIEASRQVPSTTLSLQLARVLGCGVEDLFTLAGPGHIQARLAAGGTGSRVALGLVDGQWAAHSLSAESHLAADGLLVANTDGALVQPLVARQELEQNVLVAGCAPLLGLLASRIGRRYRDARATWVPANSHGALDLLDQGLVHVAGLHLVDDQLADDHAAVLQRRFPGRPMAVINLTRWRQGLVLADGNPLGIRGAADLLRPGIRFAQREAGAGAHKLIHGLLAGQGAGIASGPVASGHAAVARLVQWGVADAGVAIEGAALAAGLSFVPLCEERFDLIVPRDRLHHGPVVRLLEMLEQPGFVTEASQVPGYDLSLTGQTRMVAA